MKKKKKRKFLKSIWQLVLTIIGGSIGGLIVYFLIQLYERSQGV